MADHDHGHRLELQELEPSPVEETPSGYNQDGKASQDGYFPPSNRSSTSTLGLSSHTPIWYLSRLQKYSSYVFSAFAAAHITNTSIIPLITRSVPESERYLLLTRPYYQGIPAEPLLIIIPLWTHVLSGLGIRILRRRANEERYGSNAAVGDKSVGRKSWGGFFDSRYWPAVSSISKSGFVLAPLLMGHAFINRVIPKNSAGGSSNINLSYVSHAFARHPVVSFVGFGWLVTVACWHTTWGMAKWWSYTPEQTTTMGPEREVVKKRRWYIINGVAAALTGLWLAGSFGVIGRAGEAPGYVGRLYDELYRQIPLVGRWL